MYNNKMSSEHGVLYILAFRTVLEAAMNKNVLNNYSLYFCCKILSDDPVPE